MKRRKYSIAIIEPSSVICIGLKTILKGSIDFGTVHTYESLSGFQEENNKPLFDALLINPATVSFYKQFAIRNLLAGFPETTLIAIHYGYIDTETLNSFDGTLDIYDSEPMILKKLCKMIQQNNDKPYNANEECADLSEREKEILISVARGLSNKEIADKHFISIHTVISHRKNITRKTGIKTVSGLTLYAVFNNLISQDDLL